MELPNYEGRKENEKDSPYFFFLFVVKNRKKNVGMLLKDGLGVVIS